MSSTPPFPSPECGVLRVDVELGDESQYVFDGIPKYPLLNLFDESDSGGKEDEIPFPWEPSIASYTFLFNYQRLIDVGVVRVTMNLDGASTSGETSVMTPTL